MVETLSDWGDLRTKYLQARRAADETRAAWDRHLAADPLGTAPAALPADDPHGAFAVLKAAEDAEGAARHALFECVQLRRTSESLRGEADKLDREASALVAREERL